MVLSVTISLRCDRGCGDGRGCDLESHRREVTVSGDVDADSLYSMTAPETLTPREESAAMDALWEAHDAAAKAAKDNCSCGWRCGEAVTGLDRCDSCSEAA